LTWYNNIYKRWKAFLKKKKSTQSSLTNRVMQAFIEDAKEKMEQCSDAAIADACLLASVQGINHFKISTYGTAAAFAKGFGYGKIRNCFS